MKIFSFATFALICYIMVLGVLSAATTAFNQVDTLPVSKKIETAPSPLEVKSAQLEEHKALLKDTIAQSLDKLGQLPPKVQQANAALKVTEKNLKETILKSDGDVQPVVNNYRIDTSPRPVIINVVFPDLHPQPEKKSYWFKRRD